MVYFRADGNSHIGLGHVTRSLALADMLSGHFECTFLVQSPTLEVAEQIKRQNHGLIKLLQTEDYLGEANKLTQDLITREDILVLDGYGFCTDYQEIIKRSGCKLVCIDDLHSWHFVADVVINQTGGIPPENYSREDFTQLYIGPAYALLRQPFLIAAQEHKPSLINGVLFICFGGADPDNLTYRTIQLVAQLDWVVKIIAVVGSAMAQREKITALQEAVPTLEVYTDVKAEEMVSLMRQCEVAVVPASGISYEVASVGLYLITGHYADNQKYLYKFLVENELAIDAGYFQNHILKKHLYDRAWLGTSIREQQGKLFAGKSSRHLLGIFIRLALKVRRAGIEDIKTYFDWANEPETRKNSINQSLITWPQHQVWFADRVENSNFIFYLFTINHKSVGQVRLEIIGIEATLSYSVDACYRGLGLGRELIIQAIELVRHDVKIKKIKASVKNDNPASLSVFEKAGFSPFKRIETITDFELQLE